MRINKFGIGNATILAKGLGRAANIVILQEQKQNKKCKSSLTLMAANPVKALPSLHVKVTCPLL